MARDDAPRYVPPNAFAVPCGMRGSVYGPGDAAIPKDLGFEVIPREELSTLDVLATRLE